MSPWIEASRPSAASRWLDESGVALRGQSDGKASVSAVFRSMSRWPITVWWTSSPPRASRNWAQGMRPGPTYFSCR